MDVAAAVDVDVDVESSSELKSDFTSYLQLVSQNNKRPKRYTPSSEHSYSSSVEDRQRDRLRSSIKTLFIRRDDQSANVTTDYVDVESVEEDTPLLTYRPSAESKPAESYRNSRPPRDPETWEQDINKVRWSKQEKNLFERAMSILYSNRLSRLTFEGTNQEDVQKIIATEKSVAEFHNLFTNIINWDLTLSRWLHKLLFSNLPDVYLASYVDILEKLKLIAPAFVNGMISPNTRGRSKEEIKSRTINLKEPVDPFNNMLTAYPPLKLPKKPVIVLIPDFPGYCTQPNTRTHDWMNALSYLAELDVALLAKKYSRKEEVNLGASLSAMVDIARMKILSLQKRNPSRPIFLAGVGVSAAIACQVAVLEKVEGLVCIGFIINSSEVKRGFVGDCILDIECPTLFVSGQLSTFSPLLDMEELRVKLKCRTGHILVGGADNELVMNHSTKMREAVTQKLVDRCVLEEIGNFLKEILDLPQKYAPKLSNKKTNKKILARPNTENQERMTSVDNQSPRRQLVGNRKIIKKPCTSTVTSAMIKDKEMMPPPSYPIFQTETSNSKKKNKEHMISDNNQSPKKKLANRKTVKIPCTSTVTSEIPNIVKDLEIIPPPSSFLTQEYPVQHGETSNSFESNQLEDSLSIQKLGNEKFIPISEILQDLECRNINSSQTKLEDSLSIRKSGSRIFTPMSEILQDLESRDINFSQTKLEDPLSIQKSVSQKFIPMSDLLQGLDSCDINFSQTKLEDSLSIRKSGSRIFTPMSEILQDLESRDINFSQTKLEDPLSIQKSVSQKFIPMSDLLQGLDSCDINFSQTNLQRSLTSSPLIFNPDQHHFVACKDFQSQGNQTNNFDLEEILAMPIVFSGPAQKVDTIQKIENSSNLCIGSNKEEEVLIEKPIDKEVDVNIAIRPEVFKENPCRQVLVRGELRDVLKEEMVSDDEFPIDEEEDVNIAVEPEVFKEKPCRQVLVRGELRDVLKEEMVSDDEFPIDEEEDVNIAIRPEVFNEKPCRQVLVRGELRDVIKEEMVSDDEFPIDEEEDVNIAIRPEVFNEKPCRQVLVRGELRDVIKEELVSDDEFLIDEEEDVNIAVRPEVFKEKPCQQVLVRGELRDVLKEEMVSDDEFPIDEEEDVNIAIRPEVFNEKPCRQVLVRGELRDVIKEEMVSDDEFPIDEEEDVNIAIRPEVFNEKPCRQVLVRGELRDVIKEELVSDDEFLIDEEEDVNIAVRPEVFKEKPCQQVLVRGELRDVIKEELISDDEAETIYNCMHTPMSSSSIPESLKIKQVAYDNKVETPKSLIPSGYQTFSKPSQNSGNIQFVNRLPTRFNKIRSTEGGAASQRSAPKIISNSQSKDINIIMKKRATESQLQLHRNKQMASKKTFKKTT